MMSSVAVMRRCLVKLNSSNRIRGFGSAAAAQLHYEDEDDDYYYQQQQQEKTSECERVGVQWVIIGDPTRRHVYADKLSKILNVPHISVQHPNNNNKKMEEDDVIFSLLSKRLVQNASQSGFILDGFPTTIRQALLLDQIAHIHLVLNLKTSFPYSLVETQLQNKPLEEYYKRQNKLFDFQPGGDTWDALLAALHLPNTTNLLPMSHRISSFQTHS